MALSVKMNTHLTGRPTQSVLCMSAYYTNSTCLFVHVYIYRGSELNKDSSIYISPTNYVHTYVYGLPFTAVFAASNGPVEPSSLQHLSASCSSCSVGWGRAEELSWGLPAAPSLHCMLESGRLCHWHPSQPSGKERKKARMTGRKRGMSQLDSYSSVAM